MIAPTERCNISDGFKALEDKKVGFVHDEDLKEQFLSSHGYGLVVAFRLISSKVVGRDIAMSRCFVLSCTTIQMIGIYSGDFGLITDKYSYCKFHCIPYYQQGKISKPKISFWV